MSPRAHDEGFVTPEAVRVDLAQAGVGSRLVAQLLDGLIVVVLVLVCVAGAAVVGDGQVAALVGAGLAFFLQIGYFAAWEALWHGQTPGKRAVGVRVLRDDGSPVTATEALLRNVLRLVDLLPVLGLAGIVSILATRRDQRIGDLAAGTIVVHDRRGQAPQALAAAGLRPPPWADQLDVSSLDERDYALARSYLQRRPELDGDARARLVARIAGSLRPKVHGAPDDATPDELVAAVVSAVRARGPDAEAPPRTRDPHR